MAEETAPTPPEAEPPAPTRPEVEPPEPAESGSLDSGTPVPAGPPSPEAAPRSTFAGRSWVTLGFTVIVIVLLIIFIAENSQRVTIHFLGAKGSIAAALALLIAAMAGALIMLLVGSTRILQLRREVRRHRRS